MALERDRIVAGAIDLLDEVGLDGVTTRRLAQALNVQGPSLYHHFRNKNELLGHMAAVIVRRSLLDLEADLPWDTWLRNLAYATRGAIMSHRDGARVLTASWPTEAMRTQIIPGVVRPLIASGFPEAIAYQAIALTASFVIGWTMNEQNSAMRDYLETLTPMDRSFAFGVDSIILGVRAQLHNELSLQDQP